jgi:hypothetical protein
MPVNMVALNTSSRYKYAIKSGDDNVSMQSLIPQQYALKLEYARIENVLRAALPEYRIEPRKGVLNSCTFLLKNVSIPTK